MFAVTVLPFNTLIVILFKGEVRQKKKKKNLSWFTHPYVAPKLLLVTKQLIDIHRPIGKNTMEVNGYCQLCSYQLFFPILV